MTFHPTPSVQNSSKSFKLYPKMCWALYSKRKVTYLQNNSSLMYPRLTSQFPLTIYQKSWSQNGCPPQITKFKACWYRYKNGSTSHGRQSIECIDKLFFISQRQKLYLLTFRSKISSTLFIVSWTRLCEWK